MTLLQGVDLTVRFGVVHPAANGDGRLLLPGDLNVDPVELDGAARTAVARHADDGGRDDAGSFGNAIQDGGLAPSEVELRAVLHHEELNDFAVRSEADGTADTGCAVFETLLGNVQIRDIPSLGRTSNEDSGGERGGDGKEALVHSFSPGCES